jgi:hypothetical protein
MTKYNASMKVILGSKMCQEAPFEDEFDLIEAKDRGENKQIKFGVYIRDLDKYEVKVLTMQKRISFAAKL